MKKAAPVARGGGWNGEARHCVSPELDKRRCFSRRRGHEAQMICDAGLPPAAVVSRTIHLCALRPLRAAFGQDAYRSRLYCAKAAA
jgi:hypothetical protein